MESTSRQFAQEVVERLVQAGYQALWAGGCVRDFLMGNAPKDFDVATSAQPREVRQLFGKKRTLAIGESFGVIVVLGPTPQTAPVEVATFRTDGSYSDGRHPDQVIFSSPEEDAQRRDFTINGMFYDPLNDQVIDYVGGKEDLNRRLLRAIGKPAARFQEDKLRMLRAIRFAARFQFTLEAETAAAMRAMAAEICVVSRERITEELRKMFRHPSRSRSLELLESSGLLFAIFPELIPAWENETYAIHTHQLISLQQSDQFELTLAILMRHLCQTLPDIDDDATLSRRVEQLGKVWKLSNAEIETTTWLLQNRHLIQQADKLPLHRLKPILIHEHIETLLEWARLDAAIEHQPARAVEFCRNFLQKTPAAQLNPPALLTGSDLIALGMKPGPEFSAILQKLRSDQLDEIIQTREQALEWITHQQDLRT